MALTSAITADIQQSHLHTSKQLADPLKSMTSTDVYQSITASSVTVQLTLQTYGRLHLRS